MPSIEQNAGQSNFRVGVRSVPEDERRAIEARFGQSLASDAVVLVVVGVEAIGWGDDYGTFWPFPDARIQPDAKVAAETLLAAATDVWAGVER